MFRFAAADKLLISGGLNNGQEMADAPALMDAKHGDGHVILFSYWIGGGSTQAVTAPRIPTRSAFTATMRMAPLPAGKARYGPARR